MRYSLSLPADSTSAARGTGRADCHTLAGNWFVAWRLVLIGWLATSCLPAGAQPRYSGAKATDDSAPRVPGFGPLEGARPIPGFGLGQDAWATAVTQEDLTRATERLQRFDQNRDGFIDRGEMRGGPWSDDPFRFDSDRDNRLNRWELARRYADRRVQATAPQSSRQNDSRADQERRDRERREQEQRDQQRRGGTSRSGSRPTRESWNLAQALFSRHDTNRDGGLDASERRVMGLDSLAADANRDQRIDAPELAVWLSQQEAELRSSAGRELPDWFIQLDADQDGQVQMSEFASGDEWTDEKLDEFLAYDANGDGIIVADECFKALSRLQNQHADTRFHIIPTRGVLRVPIEVQDDSLIADIDVQLSITHTHDDHLNAFLFGPQGEQVELFTGVGGEDDNFDNTIFDEEAPRSIVRSRPPFSGRHQTEALAKQQPGLKQFYNRSMEGSWTLMIEAKSDRPGALHGWSLIFKTLEDPSTPPQDAEFD